MSLEEYDLKKVGIFAVALLIIILAFIGTTMSVIYYQKYKVTEEKLKIASAGNPDEAKILIDKVGKLIKLPQGEIPTIATISNLEKLKNQVFFNRAKIGDKLLLYPLAKRAILYDPNDNVIIEAGPLVMPSGSPAPSVSQQTGVSGTQSAQILLPTGSISSSTDSAKIKIAVYNGTKSSSVLNNFVNEFTQKYPGADVIQKSNAAKRDYAKTVIIDLSGRKKEAIVDLTKVSGAEISALPSGEKQPDLDTDFLIILGNDQL